VAKLEAAGWLERGPWLWGDGSVAWLTRAGLEGTGFGALRAVSSPPSPTTATHGVLVGWSAARTERRGREWRSSRELAVERERWSIPVRGEHARVTRLPDLVIWLPRFERYAAIVAEHGGRRQDRQKAILEAWRHAILSGRYAAVAFDCASTSVADSISRVARNVGLDRSVFGARVQTTADDIAAIPQRSPAEDSSANLPRASA
jgi:hypothetical protein